MAVYQVKSTDEMKTKIAEAGDSLVVVDFFGTSVGDASKMIAPQVDELSKEMTDIVFLKVDVDENEDIAMEYEVSSTAPTFVFIKNGEKVDSSAGENLDELKSTIAKYK